MSGSRECSRRYSEGPTTGNGRIFPATIFTLFTTARFTAPRSSCWRHAGKKKTTLRGASLRPTGFESQRSGLNRRPLDYESSALPLSYAGNNSRGGHALARTRTATPCGTTPSRWRVYQFHHQGKTIGFPTLRTGLTGLEPATSGVTDRHSNQAELQPQMCYTCACLTINATAVRPRSLHHA